ncbi:MAG: HD domain-containing protein [Candidatus Thorarchaeota archaeon]
MMMSKGIASDGDVETIELIRKTGYREATIVTARERGGTAWMRIQRIVQEHDDMVGLAERHSRQKAIKDPVHGAIILAPWELDIISTWEMQRLRYVRQLGPAHLVYPGATHTRFEHCLGTNFLAQKCIRVISYCDDLCDRSFRPLSELFDEEHERVFRAVALLHDVGHPPASHTIEPALKSWAGFDHLDLGEHLILHSHLSDVLRDVGVNPKTVMQVLRRQSRDRILRLISEFIDSPLDIDKTDYLIRDAHFSGAELGLFPAERVLLTSRVVQDETGDYVRAFMLKALHSLEALVLSRNWMFSDLYLHHAVRVAEAMINKATYLQLEAEGFSHNECVGMFTRMGDADLHRWLSKSENDVVREYARRIRHRQLFKVVLSRRLSSFADDVRAKFVEIQCDMSALLGLEREIAEDSDRVVLDVVVPNLGANQMAQIRIITESNGPQRLITMAEAEEARPLMSALEQQSLTIPSVRVYAEPRLAPDVQKKFARLFPTES